MTLSPDQTTSSVGLVSASFSSCSGADQLAGVTVQASPRAFIHGGVK